MIRRFSRLFRLIYPYDDPLLRQRAQTLVYYLAGAGALSTMAALLVIFQAVRDQSALPLSSYFAIASPFVLIIFARMVRRGRYRAVALGIVAFGLISQAAVVNSGLNNIAILAMMLPLITAAVLLSWRATSVTSLILLLVAAQASFLNAQTTSDFADFVVVAIIIGIAALLLIAFGSNIQVAASRLFAETNKIRSVLDRAQAAANGRDDIEYAQTVVNTIRNGLDVALAQLYFVEGGDVTARMTSGFGDLNLSQDVQLSQGSAILTAAEKAQPVRLTPNSTPLERQHLLPGVRYAMAVPVMAGQRVIAVLDVQSEAANGFSPTERDVIDLIAGQLGTTISNKRLLATLRADLDDQNRLIRSQRERLSQLEQSQERATTVAWETYLQRRGLDYLGFDISANSDMVLSETMDFHLRNAVRAGDIEILTENGIQIVRVPIMLRGQTLGAMSFRVPEGTQVIGNRQRELIRSVVQRLALALENKRLFEQSQAQAKRESTANQIGNMLLSSKDVDTVMQMAAQNFNTALSAVSTHIRLQPEATATTEETS